jgi:hypothetical protein
MQTRRDFADVNGMALAGRALHGTTLLSYLYFWNPSLMSMIRSLTACAFYLVTSVGAFAQSVAPIDTLVRAIGLPELIEIMRQEGMTYGVSLEDDLFNGQGGARWAATVADIYDLQDMQNTVRDRMDSDLAAANLAGVTDFFLSDRGKRIVQLELSARQAMLDKDVELAARERAKDVMAKDDERAELLRDFIGTGDMIENNVVGAMNSNFAFYEGLSQNSRFAAQLTTDQILADVWGQEPEIRKETSEWLFGYLAMAYQPLSDADLQAYVDFFDTPEGRALNQAIFNAFDEMFVSISRNLGSAAALRLEGEEL